MDAQTLVQLIQAIIAQDNPLSVIIFVVTVVSIPQNNVMTEMESAMMVALQLAKSSMDTHVL